MKKLLFCLLLLPLHSIAQVMGPEYVMDRADSAMYSSKEEYNFQQQQKAASSHKHLVVFYGANFYWTNELSSYLQQSGWTIDENASHAGERLDEVVYHLTPRYVHLSGHQRASWICIKVRYDLQSKATKQVAITGDATNMLSLFLNYWQSPLSLTELKGKRAISQDFASDRVVFNWNDGRPRITISPSGIRYAWQHD